MLRDLRPRRNFDPVEDYSSGLSKAIGEPAASGARAMDVAEAAAIEGRCIMPTYSRFPVVFVRGTGCRLIDSEERSYLDFVAGIATTSLGHAHPELAEAVAEQAALLVHTSNLYYTVPQLRLAEELRRLNGWGRVFYASSGAEAIECAIKLVRKYWHLRDPARRKIVAFENSFHGRTMGALSITGQPSKRIPFEPLVGSIEYVDPRSPEHICEVIKDAGALFLEVIQGEGGIHPLGVDAVRAINEAREVSGALVVVDEVQTGLCRTGKWLAFHHERWQVLRPDIFTLGKALGNGFPISACVAREEVASAFAPGEHGTTLGGGPVVSAVACKVLEIMRRLSLDDRAARYGKLLAAAVASLPGIREVRGEGLLLGADTEVPAKSVAEAALQRGLLINAVGEYTIRLCPPLVITEDDIEEGVEKLKDALETSLQPCDRKKLL